MTEIATVVQLKRRAEELETALQLATGAIAALMAELNMPEYRRVRFIGRWAHLGTITLDDVLDRADEALGAGQ